MSNKFLLNAKKSLFRKKDIFLQKRLVTHKTRQALIKPSTALYKENTSPEMLQQMLTKIDIQSAFLQTEFPNIRKIRKISNTRKLNIRNISNIRKTATMGALLDRLEKNATTIQTLRDETTSLRFRLDEKESEMLELKKKNEIDAVYKTVTERLQNVYQNNVSLRDRLQNELYEEKKTTENLQNKINEINERNELQNKINEKRATLTEVLKQEVVDANAVEGSTV